MTDSWNSTVGADPRKTVGNMLKNSYVFGAELTFIYFIQKDFVDVIEKRKKFYTIESIV